jgi:hypothetical protein
MAAVKGGISDEEMAETRWQFLLAVRAAHRSGKLHPLPSFGMMGKQSSHLL